MQPPTNTTNTNTNAAAAAETTNAAAVVAAPAPPMAVRDLLVAPARVDALYAEGLSVVPTHTVVTQRALLRGMVLLSGGPIGESIIPFISVEGTTNRSTVLASFAPNQREDMFLREDRRNVVLGPHHARAMQKGLRLSEVLFPSNDSHVLYTAPPLATYRLMQGAVVLLGNATGTGLGTVIYCLSTARYMDIVLSLSISLDHLSRLYHSFWEQQQQQPHAPAFAFPAPTMAMLTRMRLHPGLLSYAVPPTTTSPTPTTTTAGASSSSASSSSASSGNNNNHETSEAVQALVGLGEAATTTTNTNNSKRPRLH